LKIASIFAIGPRLSNIFGKFDIIIYDRCAEFAMEGCFKCLKNTKLTENIIR